MTETTPAPAGEDLKRAEWSANMVSDCAMEALALIARGMYVDAAQRLGEAAKRAETAQRLLRPGTPSKTLRDRYIAEIGEYWPALAVDESTVSAIVDRLLAVRDAELQVLTDANTRLAGQVRAVQRVLDEQKAWCSGNRVDVPSWVGTVEAAMKEAGR